MRVAESLARNRYYGVSYLKVLFYRDSHAPLLPPPFLALQPRDAVAVTRAVRDKRRTRPSN